MDETSSGVYEIKASEASQVDPSFTHEFLIFASVLHTNTDLPGLTEALEREMLDICLHFGILESAADETLGIKDTKVE
jgi:hypothetical protein